MQFIDLIGERIYRIVQKAKSKAHGHLRSIMIAPCSSYSYLLIHIYWKEPHDERMLPPTQGVNFFSAEEMTLTLTF